MLCTAALRPKIVQRLLKDVFVAGACYAWLLTSTLRVSFAVQNCSRKFCQMHKIILECAVLSWFFARLKAHLHFNLIVLGQCCIYSCSSFSRSSCSRLNFSCLDFSFFLVFSCSFSDSASTACRSFPDFSSASAVS
ncbi:MAG: hypothetical protein QG652_852 [Pseudomonadota bacterium]|nr:hypothetical protein [Pseudomonadota bacterium]